ncbi:MAG: hypothetical protein Q8K83_07810 [Methylotenera sp.]|nr:hypothetical protein [Methylotenera sp.]
MAIERPRFQLNRGLVIIRYKQPYVDWVKIAGDAPMEISLQQANDDGDSFLLPTYESQIDPVDGTEDAIKWVEKRWRMFFEHILESWILDEAEWPQKRSLKMFREWFDIEYKSIVWDMGTEPLIIEEWDDEDEYFEDERLH